MKQFIKYSLGFGVVFCLGGLAAVGQESGQYPERTLKQLAANSELVISGRIVRVVSLERENDLAEYSYNQEKRYEVRLAWIEVEQVFQGAVRPNQKVKLVYPAKPRIADEPVYEDNAQGIWFLRRSEKRGEYLADHPKRFQPLSMGDQIAALIESMKIDDGDGDAKKNKRREKQDR
jgi:hypothetical protein